MARVEKPYTLQTMLLVGLYWCAHSLMRLCFKLHIGMGVPRA